MKYGILILLVGTVGAAVFYAKEIEKMDVMQLNDAIVAKVNGMVAIKSESGNAVLDGMQVRKVKIDQLVAQPDKGTMTLHQLTNNKDPDAYQRWLESNTKRDRTEADKLLNFFARGKYE